MKFVVLMASREQSNLLVFCLQVFQRQAEERRHISVYTDEYDWYFDSFATCLLYILSSIAEKENREFPEHDPSSEELLNVIQMDGFPLLRALAYTEDGIDFIGLHASTFPVVLEDVFERYFFLYLVSESLE